MSRKQDEPKKPKAQPEDPLKHRAFDALKSARDALARKAEEEEQAKKEADERERQRREALGLKQRPVEREKKKTEEPAPVRSSIDGVWRPDLDKELFAAAMSGVQPLGAGSTRVAPTGKPSGKRDVVATKARRDSAEGDEGLTVRWNPDGTCEAARKGRSFALEALARFAVPEDELDLHGLDVTAAQLRVVDFVRSRRASGKKVVAVIHGVGKHSPDGTSVLRDIVASALSQAPGSREVDAFCSAAGTSAGSASILVALRAR